MQGFHTKELLHLGSITNDTTFTLGEVWIETPLLGFIMRQSDVIVYNENGRVKRMSPHKAIEKANQSSCGVTITLTYDYARPARERKKK